MKSVKDIYNKYKNSDVIKTGTYFFIDIVCECLFDDYDSGIAGYEQRERVRNRRPCIYDELEKVACLEDFEALIARIKLEGV